MCSYLKDLECAEGVVKRHEETIANRLPILRHLGRGSAEIDLRAYGQEATLSHQAPPTGQTEHR